jgi:uncharacterized protein YggE
VKPTNTAALVLAAAAVIAVTLALRPSSPTFAASGAALAATVAQSPPADPSGPTPAPGTPQPTLTFSGDGTVDLRPDTATLDVTAVGDGDTSQAALALASRRMSAVLAALRSLDSVHLSDSDLQTGSIDTYQDWEGPRTWHASQDLSVTLHDPQAAGRVLAAANAAGADQVSGPSFSVSDQRAAERSALRQALADARAKADAAAAALGGHVTGVVSVMEQGAAQVVPMGIAMERAAVPTAASAPAPPIQQGTQQVEASVSVTFSYA